MPPLFSLLAYHQGPRHKLGPVFACSPRGPASDVGLTSRRRAWRKRRSLLPDSFSKSLITHYAHPTHLPTRLPRTGKGTLLWLSFPVPCTVGPDPGGPRGRNHGHVIVKKMEKEKDWQESGKRGSVRSKNSSKEIREYTEEQQWAHSLTTASINSMQRFSSGLVSQYWRNNSRPIGCFSHRLV